VAKNVSSSSRQSQSEQCLDLLQHGCLATVCYIRDASAIYTCRDLIQQDGALSRSTDVWATRRLGDRRLGDIFLDDRLGDTGWTFRRQQLDVWSAMNLCSGKGFFSSESTSVFDSRLERL